MGRAETWVVGLFLLAAPSFVAAPYLAVVCLFLAAAIGLCAWTPLGRWLGFRTGEPQERQVATDPPITRASVIALLAHTEDDLLTLRREVAAMSGRPDSPGFANSGYAYEKVGWLKTSTTAIVERVSLELRRVAPDEVGRWEDAGRTDVGRPPRMNRTETLKFFDDLIRTAHEIRDDLQRRERGV